MNCSTLDLKAYALGEIDRQEKAALDAHVGACEACRGELDRLKLTHAALLTLKDEEVPRRIAFVSDGIFEPRWWQAIWRSGPAMGFASAALIAVAILAHGYARPTAAQPVQRIDTAQIEQRVEQEVSQRLDSAVTKAVTASEERQGRKTAEMLAAAEKRYRSDRKADLIAAAQTMKFYQQQAGRFMVAYNGSGSER
jgi:anti-sigma factor RsiW